MNSLVKAGAPLVSQPPAPESLADDVCNMGAFPQIANFSCPHGVIRCLVLLTDHAYLADQTIILYLLQIELSAETTWPRRAQRALTDDLPLKSRTNRLCSRNLYVYLPKEAFP
jgi:hypothetical protein